MFGPAASENGVTAAPQDLCLYQVKAQRCVCQGRDEICLPAFTDLSARRGYVARNSQGRPWFSSRCHLPVQRQPDVRGVWNWWAATTSPQSLHRQMEEISAALTKKRHGQKRFSQSSRCGFAKVFCTSFFISSWLLVMCVLGGVKVKQSLLSLYSLPQVAQWEECRYTERVNIDTGFLFGHLLLNGTDCAWPLTLFTLCRKSHKLW